MDQPQSSYKASVDATSINPPEIARIINDIYDGVNRSKVGPIVKDNELGKTEMQTLAFNTFLYCLSAFLPKNVSANMSFEEIKKNEV